MFRLREHFVPVRGRMKSMFPLLFLRMEKNVPGVGTCAGTERGTYIPRFGTLLGTNVPLVIGAAGTYLGRKRKRCARWRTHLTRVHAVGARIRGWRSGEGGWGHVGMWGVHGCVCVCVVSMGRCVRCERARSNDLGAAFRCGGSLRPLVAHSCERRALTSSHLARALVSCGERWGCGEVRL